MALLIALIVLALRTIDGEPARAISSAVPIGVSGSPPADRPIALGIPWDESRDTVLGPVHREIGEAQFTVHPGADPSETCVKLEAPDLGEEVTWIADCIPNEVLDTRGWAHVLQIGGGPISVWGIAPLGKDRSIVVGGATTTERSGRLFYPNDVSVARTRSVSGGATELDVTFDGRDGAIGHRIRF